jgi:hypothetical protein
VPAARRLVPGGSRHRAVAGHARLCRAEGLARRHGSRRLLAACLPTIMRIEWAHETPISWTITGPMTEQEAADLLRELEAVATKAEATGNEQPVTLSQAQRCVQPPGSRGDGLQFSVPETDSWPRIAGKLRGKAEQAQASGGGWLRADILDGTWAFTDWGRSGLRASSTRSRAKSRPSLPPTPQSTARSRRTATDSPYGQVIGESARSAADCYALRRLLPGARARETMIIAANDTGRLQARTWVDIYGPEDSWLGTQPIPASSMGRGPALDRPPAEPGSPSTVRRGTNGAESMSSSRRRRAGGKRRRLADRTPRR